jgi:L-lysine 2,3-aminomutase
VQGAAHFEVPLSTGLRLADLLHSLLPGYLVPKFVQEIPGKSGKTVLSTSSRELECPAAPAPVEWSAP